MATQKLALWGNSLGVRLPQSIAQEIGLKAGSIVNIATEGKTIVLSAADPRYTLEELLNKAKPEQQHGEVDWGAPVGDESW